MALPGRKPWALPWPGAHHGELPSPTSSSFVEDNAQRADTTRRASRLTWAKFWLVVTGVWWGIAMQLLVYRGAGEPEACLPNLDWYAGMLLLYLARWLSADADKYPHVLHRHVIPITLCDLLGTVGTTVGLEMAGSAIFGIIYSSVTVWTALFTCLILRKAQSKVKLLGIFIVVVGLSVPAFDSSQSQSYSEAHTVFLGILLTSAGTLFYALECLQSPSLASLVYLLGAFVCGAWGLLVTMVWFVCYTIPHWEEAVATPVRENNGKAWVILALFASHAVNNAVHNAAWFIVCELEGGVSTGLLMGVKAAALFFGSAIFFCDELHEEQCLTTHKVVATVVVLIGTSIYYMPSLPSSTDDDCCCMHPILARMHREGSNPSIGLPIKPPRETAPKRLRLLKLDMGRTSDSNGRTAVIGTRKADAQSCEPSSDSEGGASTDEGSGDDECIEIGTLKATAQKKKAKSHKHGARGVGSRSRPHRTVVTKAV